MPLTAIVTLGLAAGLHGALYGAYKDSPHESFRAGRFAREIAIALCMSLGLALFHPGAGHQTAFVLYLSIFALTRIGTEFWKLFIRVEPQDDFRIPTQIHCVTGIDSHPVLRLLLALGFLLSIYGVWALCALIPAGTPATLCGLLVGLTIGVTEAIAGSYKDGTIEGFYVFGAIGGIVASGHTADLAFLLLASIGTMRMLLELLFKLLVRDYAPGKFPSMVGAYAEWVERRQRFVMPYGLAWLLYLVLCSR